MASEDYATEGQIKRLYAVLHSIGIDPKQWKKDKNIASYAKLTRAQCSAFIDDAEAIEAQQKNKLHAERREVESGVQDRIDHPGRAEAEAQRIREEQGLAAAPAQPAVPATPAKPTVPELIAKYTDILAQVTVSVRNNDTFIDREKGYVTNWVANAVKGAMENGKGGDREE